MRLTPKQLADLLSLLQAYPELLGAYLFGSQANGTASRLSDVDIGLVLRPNLIQKERHQILGKIFSDVSRLLKTDFIDLVDLQQAPVLLRYKAVMEGTCLFANDRTDMNRFTMDTVKLFEDFRPHLEVQQRFILNKIRSYVAH